MSKLKDLVKGFTPKGVAEGTISTIIEKGADVVDRFVTTEAERDKMKREWAKIVAEDVANARSTEVERIKASKSWVGQNLNAVLSLGIVALSFILFGILALVKVEPLQKDIIIYVLGALTAYVGQIVTYYFGSSQGSKDKTDALNKLIK